MSAPDIPEPSRIPQEEWREVPSIPGVYASSLGRIHVVRDVDNSRTTRGTRTVAGYRTVSIKGLVCLIHRLVCEAFNGPEPQLEERVVVMHKDDDPEHNTPENLQWGTHRENLSTPAHTSLLSRKAVARMKDPARRERAAEVMREKWRDPEYRARGLEHLAAARAS